MTRPYESYESVTEPDILFCCNSLHSIALRLCWLVFNFYICSIATLSSQHTTCHRRMDATTKTWIWIKGFCCVFFSHHLLKNKHNAMKNAALSYLYTHELLLRQSTSTSLLGIVVAILNVVVFNLVFYFYKHKTVYRLCSNWLIHVRFFIKLIIFV